MIEFGIRFIKKVFHDGTAAGLAERTVLRVLPSELREQLQRFITYFNRERYYESLNNLTPADVFYGRGQAILDQRVAIKLNTLVMCRKMHYDSRNDLNLMG